jgi:hypothetical protein
MMTTTETRTNQYATIICRAWTKETLAIKIQDALSDIERENIVSINITSIPWIPLRPNTALITVTGEVEAEPSAEDPLAEWDDTDTSVPMDRITRRALKHGGRI